MLWVVVAFLVYLLGITWSLIDHGHLPVGRAFTQVFFVPFIYLIIGVPYYLFIFVRWIGYWLWDSV